MRNRLLTAVTTLCTLAVIVPGASAKEITVKGWNKAPGPRSFDTLKVSTFGPASAKTVLVLIPGTLGGRGNFALVGKELAAKVPGLQVWSMDRRSNKLEDTSAFEAVLKGTKTPKEALDYYVGWLTDPTITPHYQPPDVSTLSFAADWGMEVQMEDARRLVLAAKAKGKRVILGGHSLGASATVAYASWDFAGRPGYKDLDGLMLIDGGLKRSFGGDDTAIADLDGKLAAIQKAPFSDLLQLGIPWTTGVLAELGAVAALKDPKSPSIAQAFPLLPAALKAPGAATNEGQFGYAFDASTSPAALSLIQVRAGALGADGNWVDGEVTPIQNLAQVFGREPGNSVEWFFPTRLSLDTQAASPLSMTADAKKLGLRLKYGSALNLPIYAIQTSLTKGGVLAGAKRLIADSKIQRLPAKDRVLVNAEKTNSHLDPITAAPKTSAFLKTSIPWLKRLVKR